MRYKNPQKNKRALHERRRARVRARVFGTAERPRLSVGRTLKHIYAQLVDDSTGKTLAAASDLETKALKKLDVGERQGKVAAAYSVGLLVAERAKEKKITQAVFDRAGRKYHGRTAAVADGARAGGLKI
ncbi:50S ribosomal protein L18 [Patescibacteria group bacterium]|nr:MAG: 50S ribosomal protein L18 [Patescibacteria group bacterium]